MRITWKEKPRILDGLGSRIPPILAEDEKGFVAPAAAPAEQLGRQAVLPRGVELPLVNFKSKRNVVWLHNKLHRPLVSNYCLHSIESNHNSVPFSLWYFSLWRERWGWVTKELLSVPTCFSTYLFCFYLPGLGIFPDCSMATRMSSELRARQYYFSFLSTAPLVLLSASLPPFFLSSSTLALSDQNNYFKQHLLWVPMTGPSDQIVKKILQQVCSFSCLLGSYLLFHLSVLLFFSLGLDLYFPFCNCLCQVLFWPQFSNKFLVNKPWSSHLYC